MSISKKDQLKWNKPKRKRKRASKAKPTKNYLDDKLLGSKGAWVLLVKARANNRCEYCGKKEGLNAHHIYSKSNRSTRYSLDNGCCLCTAHHVFSSGFSAHKTPMEFSEWILENRGEAWYNRLKEEKLQTKKWDVGDLNELIEQYKEELAELTK